MFTEIEFSGARDESCQQAAEVLKCLKTLKCPTIHTLKIALGELKAGNEEKVKSWLAQVPPGRARNSGGESDYIYVIQVGPRPQEVMKSLLRALQQARQTRKDYPRINNAAGANGTLYVGRTCTPRSRLSQHLGTGHSGTYALHLGRWATNTPGKIAVSYFELNRSSNLLVQAVEDGVWQKLRPAFGRQGAR